MKVSVDLEILEKYIPADELAAILEKAKVTRDKNKERQHKRRHALRHALQENCHALQGKTCEISPKMQILAENGSRGGEGGVLFINDPCNLNGTVTPFLNNKEKNKIKKEKVCENHGEEISRNFELFWNAWPKHFRKINKPAAFKKFAQAFKTDKGLSFETIMKALEWWKNNQWRNNEQFIKNPAAWLHQRDYEVLNNVSPEPSELPRVAHIAPPPPTDEKKRLSHIEFAALFRGAVQ